MQAQSSSSYVPRLYAGGGCITVGMHGERAIFTELSSTYPLKLLSPSIQDRTALVYLLNYGGGLVGGDKVDLTVKVEAGARLILLSQGTTKVFKTRPKGRLASVKDSLSRRDRDFRDLTTRQILDFRIAPTGLLLLLPEPVTCFRNASYNQNQRFHIHGDGSVVILDWITSGRVSLDEKWDFSRYYSVNEIFHDGKRIAKDVVLLDNEGLGSKVPERSLRERLQPYSCYAMLILHGPQVDSIIEDITRQYDQISVFKTKTPAQLIWSLSFIDSTKQGAVIRVAGIETEKVKGWVKDTLSGLEGIVGLDAYRRVFP